MARTVEGVFRSQAQAETALQELKARGLDRDVSLVPSGTAPNLPETQTGVSPAMQDGPLTAGLGGGGGGALGQSPEGWFQAPFRMKVTTSNGRAPEVAQLLRQYGAEEVDLA